MGRKLSLQPTDAFEELKRHRASAANNSTQSVIVLGVEMKSNDAAVRLIDDFKRIDAFKSSSMTRGGRKVVR